MTEQASPSIPRIPFRPYRLLALVVIYVLVAHVLPRPAGVDPDGWRITGIFFATIAGLMLQPLPGTQIVVIGVTMLIIVGGVPMDRALSGFAAPSVWLVLMAMLMSRALRETGLSRRIALFFVKLFGRTSLGVSYSLVLSDVTLATGVPSITARSGSIMFPIARSISDLFKSAPGPSSALLGTFLMTSLYQTSVVASAMFFTGAASNVLMAELAREIVPVTWSSWFMAAIVPGLVSCAAVPYMTYRLVSPQVKHTPEAVAFAQEELQRMGPLRGREAIVLAVFVGVVGLWMTSAWHGLHVTLVSLMGISTLFFLNALTWESALAERSAWDVFVWYGGLLMMGGVLNDTGSTTAFANWVSGLFGDTHWFMVLLGTLVVYFYSHYAFASITAHALSMFLPFVLMLTALGTPPSLAVYSLACLSNLMAGLTHYGTTTAPIIYVEGYVGVGDWWRVGFLISVGNLAIWLTVGFAWWKFLGFW